MSSSASATRTGVEQWTVRSLIARHKAAALGAAAVCAVIVAMALVAALGAKAGPVTDTTTCTGWGSANQRQQNAYARLYVSEHGAVPGGGTSPASVITAINDGCGKAFGEDVSDSTTVAQAISGNF